jgi:hypothetical protein
MPPTTEHHSQAEEELQLEEVILLEVVPSCFFTILVLLNRHNGWRRIKTVRTATAATATTLCSSRKARIQEGKSTGKYATPS